MLNLAPLIGQLAAWRVPGVALLSLAMAVALVSGCSGSHSAAPVNPQSAREALKTALEGWKKGDTPDALKSSTPSITAQDLDWLAGTKLVDFAVSADDKSIEANLYVPVTLTLKAANGKEVKKKVTYVVGTSPYLTVFRALN
jgi:hypothetical protein